MSHFTIRTLVFGAGVLVRALHLQLLHEAKLFETAALVQRLRDGRVDNFKPNKGYCLKVVQPSGVGQLYNNMAVGSWLVSGEQWRQVIDTATLPSLQFLVSNTGEETLNLTREQKVLRPARLLEDLPNPGFFLGQIFVVLLARWQHHCGPLWVLPAELDINNAPLMLRAMKILADNWLNHSDRDNFLSYLSGNVHFRRTLVDRLTPQANVTPSNGNAQPDVVTESFAQLAIEYVDGDRKLCNHPQLHYVKDVRPLQRRKNALVNFPRSLIVQRALMNGWSTDKLFSEIMGDPALRDEYEQLLYGALLPAVRETDDAERFAHETLRRFSVEEVSSSLLKVMAGSFEGHLKKLRSRGAQFLAFNQSAGLPMPKNVIELLSHAGFDPHELLDEQLRRDATISQMLAS